MIKYYHDGEEVEIVGLVGVECIIAYKTKISSYLSYRYLEKVPYDEISYIYEAEY